MPLHHPPQVWAAAVKALVTAGSQTEHERVSAICDPDHQARLEAGRYKQEVARFLINLAVEALSALTEWIEGRDADSRYMALEMLPVLLAAVASRKEESVHAVAS